MIPQSLVDFVAKWAVLIIAGVIIILFIVGWVWWNHHMNLKNAVAVPKAQGVINAAQSTAGSAAVNTVQDNQKKNEDTDRKTQQVTNVYNTYPQAKAPLDPGFVDAFNRGICLYKSAASLPECQRLQQVNP
jgi:predicted negative regulator of RcsB-dependent stress response